MIGSKLKELRKSLGLTQEELAEIINKKYGTSISKGMISKWENDKEEPRMDSMRYLVDFFNASLDELLGIKIVKAGSGINQNNIKMPFFGNIAAGALSTIEPVTNGNVKYIHIPKELLGKDIFSNNLFMLKVNGESMNKIIPNGSNVICKAVNINEIKDGDIVIFSYDNEFSMKRFRRDPKNKLLIFSPESTDPKFYDIVIPYDTQNDLKIYAKVIWYGVNLE